MLRGQFIKLRNQLTKQYDIGPAPGALKDLVIRTLVYATVWNTLLLAAVGYHTTLREVLLSWVPWLSFPVFIAVLATLFLIPLIIEWKFILPSTIIHLNKQSYQHQNLVRRQLDGMERVLDRIENTLAKTQRTAKVDSPRFCNICGWQGEQFDSFYNVRMRQQEEALCPNCNSLSRQRALFKHLQSEDKGKLLCLEIAPHSSDPVRSALKGIDYISVALYGSRAMLHMDLRDLPFPDNTFDLIVCSHVLEHITDDSKAISVIHRVLKKDGVTLIQIPIGYYKDHLAPHTVEFGRERFYGHFRSYGWDFKEKLTQAGFEVNPTRFADSDSVKLGIENETIFECIKKESKDA